MNPDYYRPDRSQLDKIVPTIKKKSSLIMRFYNYIIKKLCQHKQKEPGRSHVTRINKQ